MTANRYIAGFRAKFRKAILLMLGLSICFNSANGYQSDEKDGGFGVNKNDVTFILTHPPKLLITQKTYSLNISGTQFVIPAITSAIKPVIYNAKSGINSVGSDGELRINLNVAFAYEARPFTRKVKVTKVKKETNEEYEVEEMHKFTAVESTFEVSYEFQDWTGGQPTTLDSDRLVTPKLEEEIDLTAGKDKPTSEMDAMSRGVAYFARVMHPLFNETDERVEVILGRVKDMLKGGVKLAEANNWEAALNAWQAVPPFRFPKAESYRVYNLGVANEALGHAVFKSGQSVDKTLTLLDEARKMYEKALSLKPGEKFFRESWRGFDPPLTRINKAIAAYQAWKTRKEALLVANRSAVDVLLSDNKRTRTVSSQPDKAMTNEDVVEMVKAKASDDFIIETINNVSSTNFDLSVQGRIGLLKNGVSEKVIREMQQKQAPK